MLQNKRNAIVPPPAAHWPVAWLRAGPPEREQLGPAGTAQASHQLMVQLIQGYPAAAWLPPNQIINSSRAGNTFFIFFLYPYGAGEGKKKKRFLGWQPSQTLKIVIHPQPQPASSLLITRGRHSGIAFKKCLPPSCLRSYESSSCSLTLDPLIYWERYSCVERIRGQPKCSIVFTSCFSDLPSWQHPLFPI